jgi:quinol monooxygenase YgiN
MTFARRSLDEASLVLRSLVGPVRAETGCAVTRILRDLDDRKTLTFVEEWRDTESLTDHLQGLSFRTLLEVIELADRAPTIEIDDVASRHGFELIEQILGQVGRREFQISNDE